MKNNLINDEDQTVNKKTDSMNDLEVNSNKSNKTTKIDILNLPKRSTIHDKARKKTTLKFNKTFFRFIIVVLFIVGILGGGVYLKYIN